MKLTVEYLDRAKVAYAGTCCLIKRMDGCVNVFRRTLEQLWLRS